MFGAGVFTQQCAECGLGGLLLAGQFADLHQQPIELLLAMELVSLLLLDGLLAFLLLGQFIALMAQLLQTLADLLVQLHEGRCWRRAQAFQGLGG